MFKKVFFIAVLSVLIAGVCFAGVTNTPKFLKYSNVSERYYYDIEYTDDGSGFTYTVVVPKELYGTVPIAAYHKNGAPTITDGAADIVVTWHGQDIFGSGLVNIPNDADKAADFQHYAPLDSTGLTVTYSGNLVSGAKGTIRIIFQ